MMSETKPKAGRKWSTIPGIGSKASAGDRSMGKDDSYGNTFEAFSQSGIVAGYNQGYGSDISDRWRLFYSTREPVGVWWIVNVANDIFDNWFQVKDIKEPDSKELDNKIQKELLLLKARMQLPRETIFERRYGTAILLLGYSEPDMSWEKPLFEPKMGEKPDKLDNSRLLQITPYPWTEISNVELDTDANSLRYGLPEFYIISTGYDDRTNPLPPGLRKNTTKIHWTRVIHDAPRLDEHPYLGVSAIDAIFDDLVGGRNARWGMYQGYYRNGQGFPKIQTKGTKKENEDWVAAGGVDNLLNARTYFVCGEGEDIEFVGSEGAALNPATYFDTYFTFISAATNITADYIKGVGAGRVTGNEAGERKYFKAISLLQHQKEVVLREIIDRLIQTGQVQFDGDYFIDWVDPFEVNPQDKASIEYLQERTNALRLQSETIDEVRARKALPPLPDGAGEQLLPQPGQFGSTDPTIKGANNQEEPSATRPPEQPNENPAEQNQSVASEEKTLFNSVINGDIQ